MIEAAHQLVGMAGLMSLQSVIPLVARKQLHTLDVNNEMMEHHEHIMARLAYEVMSFVNAKFVVICCYQSEVVSLYAGSPLGQYVVKYMIMCLKAVLCAKQCNIYKVCNYLCNQYVGESCLC
jgi:hypothetical protein